MIDFTLTLFFLFNLLLFYAQRIDMIICLLDHLCNPFASFHGNKFLKLFSSHHLHVLILSPETLVCDLETNQQTTPIDVAMTATTDIKVMYTH